MSYPITDIDGIDGEAATILKSVGIRSTERLLEAARTVRGLLRWVGGGFEGAGEPHDGRFALEGAGLSRSLGSRPGQAICS